MSNKFQQTFMTIENSALCFKNYLDDNNEKLFWQKWGSYVNRYEGSSSFYDSRMGYLEHDIAVQNFNTKINVPTSNEMISELYDMLVRR